MLRAVDWPVNLSLQLIQKQKRRLWITLLLTHISKERIRDEFTRILMSDNPQQGIELARKFGLLEIHDS
jgi:tRNA nucleotidyltransferase/poly(A) polymerase